MKLIRIAAQGYCVEVIEIGERLLNPQNPNACICMALSNLALRDFEEALRNTPRLRAERIGDPFIAPLKILAVNENQSWIDFLTREHGLRSSPPEGVHGRFPYWHELTTWIIKRR